MDVFQSNPPEQDSRERQLSPAARRALHSVAMMAGVALAFLLAIGGGPVAVWEKPLACFHRGRLLNFPARSFPKPISIASNRRNKPNCFSKAR